MVRAAILLLALVAAPAVLASNEQGSGVQKVLAMLQDMSAKAKQEKKDEEVAFAKFSVWCKEGADDLAAQIVKEGEEIELLTANIAKLESDVSTLSDEIAKAQALVVKSEDDLKAQKAQREKDHKDFLVQLEDYTESISGLEQAIVEEQKANKDVAGSAAASLLQIDQKRLPQQAKSLVSAFKDMMADDPEFLQSAAPEAKAFEATGESAMIETMTKLDEDFIEKKGQIEKEEMNSVHAYNMVVMDLTDTIENTNKEIQSKVELKEAKQTKAGEDKKQLASTISTKKEDESTLSNMDTECKEKTLSFDEKNQLRAEEIEALNKAIEILSADDVSGNAAKHLALLQATSFAQMRGTNSGTDYLSAEGIHRRLREFLAKEGKRLKSQRLSLLADKLLANPFGKVKKLIDDMITRLLEEANEDASHEGFCDKEMGESKITRNKLNEEIDALQAAVEDGKATIMTLTNEIADLEKEMSDLSAAMTEATSMRTAEKKKNAATIKDAQAAQNAVTAATAVLKDFYTKAAKATGFIQTAADQTRPKMGTDEWKALANPNFKGTVDSGHKAGMQTFGKKFTGQQDSASGVLAMLEVIASDFENLISDTEAAESAGKTGFDNFMTESKKAVKMKNKKIELDGSDKTDAEAKLREDVADLKNTQDELLAAERYYDKLVPQCIDKGMTFEERTAAREAEIASLKEALEILGSQGSIETSA
eukprot:gnl/TRDRNA2_/TRDRNA2_177327_c3_seq12.p1 gnl/TRDRNA2_/TRDRNA2_177327_c3~~gnl/TRDRNA2_/TRDRNA2_177327_c3_seq12.p1  ORF type:complete len:709 (-),score=278.12 gnl/TRDRNA2_/TRDRNA2_177327_c3_seq12:102-2228(-)